MRFLYLALSVGCFGSGYAAGAIIGHEQADRHLPALVESLPEVTGACRRVSFETAGVRVEIERDGAFFVADPGAGKKWLMLPVEKHLGERNAQ